MNRDWIRNPNRVSAEYLRGIGEFLNVASKHVNDEGYTKCPCQNCNNCRSGTLREIRLHLATHGMSYNYTTWTHHGERRRDVSSSSTTRPILHHGNDIGCHNDDVRAIINDLHPYASANYNDVLEEDDDAMGDDLLEDDEPNMHRKEYDNFETLLKEAQRELYPGCEDFSVLTTVVELMHCKVMSLMSNRWFDHLLGIIKRLLPKPNNLPPSHYEADKILKGLGLGYEKIHACKYDCALFYKENEGLDKCPICNEPRYHNSSRDNKNKVPRKVLRYFPLKPRLQRLYMSMHTASDMRWHKEGRVDDEVMRHPADGTAWKEFDKLYPDFAADPRNVRLGLATDGFNPFNNMSKPYSMWPVVVVPYNLPPWRCMKKEFSIMTLLIPGDKAPGKEIDVYLQPLIDELKDLWENGVPTYDKATNSVFNLRAAVMWTINDFPAYANLSGWSTKGYNACPVCNDDGTSARFSDKICYMGHRRWLPWDHVWRTNIDAFDGKVEHRTKPRELSGEDILAQFDNLNFGQMGKHDNTQTRI